MSTSTNVYDDAGGSNQISGQTSGTEPTHENEFAFSDEEKDAAIDIGPEWLFQDAVLTATSIDSDLEFTIFSSLQRIAKFLDDNGYDPDFISAEMETYENEHVSPDFYLRTQLQLDNAEEWISVEDSLEDIILESEVGDAELYVVVEKHKG